MRLQLISSGSKMCTDEPHPGPQGGDRVYLSGTSVPFKWSSNSTYRIHPRFEHLPTGPESSAREPETSSFMSAISSSRGGRTFP